MTPIQVGVLGLRRGLDLARNAETAGLRVVAICDQDAGRLAASGASADVATCTDFEDLLAHDCEAIMLANHFHQHASFAIRALEAGKHVMSEVTSCKTPAEGVALVRAVEQSGLVYMVAENWQFAAYNQEMRRLYREGEVGKFLYGEAEYLHPMSAGAHNDLSPGVDHWRNWIPSTYYCTHSLGPLMYITETWPRTVNGFVVPRDEDDPAQTGTPKRNDTASAVIVRMDDGSLLKLLQYGLRGDGLYTRIHGNLGMMENLRHGDQGSLRVRREPHDDPAGEGYDRVYRPELPATAAGSAERSGHAGADLFVSLAFAEAISAGVQPFFDVYRGVAMSMVGIQAYRSALAGGGPVEVPDLRDEAQQVAYEADQWSPDPEDRAEGQPWPSVLGDVSPTRTT